MPQTLEAIRDADAITLGPGSLFTSLIPNLLVHGIPEAIAQSPAVKIYICNLMTQPGETTYFSAADHLRAIYEHCGRRLFDYVLVNTARISATAQKRYRAQKSQPVVVGGEDLRKLGVHVVEGDFILEKPTGPSAAHWIRHDSDRLARAALRITANHKHEAGGARRTPPRKHASPSPVAERPRGRKSGPRREPESRR
jgi:uncharacterized cofD-like protein